MAGIWALSSMRLVIPAIRSVPFQDKGVHFCVYAALGLLVIRASSITWPERGRLRVILFGALATVLWGLSDELHQAFVPGRSSELLDLLADALGALTAAAVWALIMRRRGSADTTSATPSAPSAGVSAPAVHDTRS